jgi:RHS repeat-associated protein
MVYDGDGNRVSENIGGTMTKFLVDDLNPTGLPQMMDETVSGAVTRTYAYGVQRISEDQQINGTRTPSFYGYDGHGNVRFLTNSTGTVTDSYTYDAFGMPITTSGTTPNNFLYSGEQYDGALGAYYLRARYYNPATGRFETMDPAAGHILNPATLHKYVYTGNDPVNASDPTGRGVFLEYSVRIFIFTQITVPGYIEEFGPSGGQLTAITAIAAVASAAVCAEEEAADALELISEESHGPVVTSPGRFCNEQIHPAPGGTGEGGNPPIPNAPVGGGESPAP